MTSTTGGVEQARRFRNAVVEHWFLTAAGSVAVFLFAFFREHTWTFLKSDHALPGWVLVLLVAVPSITAAVLAWLLTQARIESTELRKKLPVSTGRWFTFLGFRWLIKTPFLNGHDVHEVDAEKELGMWIGKPRCENCQVDVGFEIGIGSKQCSCGASLERQLLQPVHIQNRLVALQVAVLKLAQSELSKGGPNHFDAD